VYACNVIGRTDEMFEQCSAFDQCIWTASEMQLHDVLYRALTRL